MNRAQKLAMLIGMIPAGPHSLALRKLCEGMAKELGIPGVIKPGIDIKDGVIKPGIDIKDIIDVLSSELYNELERMRTPCD